MVRKLFVSMLVLGFFLVSCRPKILMENFKTPPPENETTISTLTPPRVTEDRNLPGWREPEIYQAGLINSQQVNLSSLQSANEYHLDLKVSEDRSSVSIQQQLLMTNLEDIPLTDLYFHVFANYNGGRIAFNKITIDDQVVDYQMEAEDTILHILLQDALLKGQDLIVSMDYILTIPTEMGGNYGLFGYFHSVMVLDTFYPMLAVYDQNGWHIGKPDPTGDLSYTDASYYSVSVDYPADMVIVASGIKTDSSLNGERETAQFAIGPARDFYLALSEDYIKLSEQVGEVMINSYALPSDKDGANIALDAAVQALNIFTSRFGDYPYKELDVISSPMQAMGIEYPGIIGIGIDLYKHDEKTDTTMNPEILESVVVHEVGHQWFYNLVGNDQVEEPWLDESITQYATSLYYIDRYPGDAVEQYRKSWQGRWDRIQQEKIPIGLPVSAYDGKTYSPIIYGRGPYFLLELEKTLGPELNAQFWKEYVARYQWQISTTGEFRQLAEEICDCQLGDLFIDWVYEVN